MSGTAEDADLNDYAYFAHVVAQSGFAAAGRALGVPKSKLSRRVAGLEARLGVRLIERSTRGFRVTEIGHALYEKCRTILREVEDAEAVVSEAIAEPQGRIRFSCPTGMMGVVSPMLSAFLARHPKVKLQVLAIDRPIDLIADGVDVALRVRITLEKDLSLTMRSIGRSWRILVASPKLARLVGDAIDELADMPTLGTTDAFGETAWKLEGPKGAKRLVRHEPRMSCADFTAVRDAAMAGLGVAFLPQEFCRDALKRGKLVRVFPSWQGPEGNVHLVFTTRRGLPPAVRAFINHLAATIPMTLARA